jgi:MFS family permease
MAISGRAFLRQILVYFGQFRGFNKDIKLFLFTNALASVVIGLSSIIQPLYLGALGYDSAEVGLLLGASGIMSVLVLFPAGVVADRYGRKKVLILSIVTYAVSFVFYAVFTEFFLLLLGSIVMGVSWGTYIGPSNAILTDKTTLDQRNYVFSLYSFLSASAIIIGSLLAGTTDLVTSSLRQTNLEAFRTMFWVAVAITFACIPALFFVRETPFKKHSKGTFSISSWRIIGILSIVNGLIGFGAGVFIPLLPIYLSSKFLATKAEIGILFAVSNAAMAVANLLAPKLSERIGQVGAIALTQGMSVIPLVLVPSSRIFYEAELLYVTRTGLMNMSSPILNAYTMSMVSRDERASVSGMTTMAWNGLNAVGTAASGVLMDVYLDLPFHVGSFFYAFSTILFWAYFSRRHQNPME